MKYVARIGALVYLALTQAQIVLAVPEMSESAIYKAVAVSLFVAGAALVGFAAGVEFAKPNSESESPPTHGTGK